MPLHRCTVRYVDRQGLSHTTTVTAESLYEAAALAVQAFRADPVIDDPGIDRTTTLEVEVQPVVVTHRLTLQRVLAWADTGGARNPSETAKRHRIRALLTTP